MAAERVLVVDHEAAVRETIAGILASEGFQCTGAASVAQALERLRTSTFELMISAVNMPGEHEQDLLDEIEQSDRKTAVLMATVEEDPLIARALIEEGVDGYLVKPYGPNELLIHVDYALARARGRRHEQDLSDESLAAANQRAAEMREALLQATEKDELADRQRVEMIGRLGEVIGLRDLETGGHIRRVGRYSALLARAAGLDQETVRAMGLAAPLHDIGKVAIPDAILLKPGPLSVGEREIMRRHAQIGHDILANSGSSLLDLAAEISLTHQEHYDGSGYPAGLSGEEIPLAGRIVAIVDAFDSITSDRPYSRRRSPERALEILLKGKGAQFDPGLIDCFIANADEILGVSTGSRADART